MGVKCQILLNKPDGQVYRAGETIAGVVRCVVDKSTEFLNVTLSCRGKSQCNWESGYGRRRETHKGAEVYVIGQINVCNQTPGQKVTLFGEYQYPFEFVLPEKIPRSYSDSVGSIKYRIEMKFETKGFFKSDQNMVKEIQVYSYLCPKTEKPVIFGVEKGLSSLCIGGNSSIRMRAKVLKSYVTPGEDIQVSLQVENNSDVAVLSMQVELLSYKIYTADVVHEKVESEKVTGRETLGVAARQEGSFSCVLPTNRGFFSIQHSKVINKEYRVRVTARLPMMHKNATVEMPILIGFKNVQ